MLLFGVPDTITPTPPPPENQGFMLLEDSVVADSIILLEDGTHLLNESAPI